MDSSWSKIFYLKYRSVLDEGDKVNYNKRRPKHSDEKIIDVIFTEEVDEHEDVDLKNFSSFKESWLMRGFSFLLLLFFLALNVIYLGFIILTALMATLRRLCGYQNWDEMLRKRLRVFRRGSVLTLASFVGIFSSRFAFTIAALYFSLFDDDPYMMDKLRSAMD